MQWQETTSYPVEDYETYKLVISRKRFEHRIYWWRL